MPHAMRKNPEKDPVIFPVLFMLGHVLLAVIFFRVRSLSTYHGLAVTALGVFFILREKTPFKAICVCFYIAGAEVLWRMTGAHLFWEYGKYAVLLIASLGILKRGFRRPGLPLTYFILLLPSTMIFLYHSNSGVVLTEVARKDISFNLSGPVTLTACALFFSKASLTPAQFKKLLWIYLGPALGVALLTYFVMFTAEEIRFSANSNFTTSGGFGPNQISAVLGLGAFLCLVSLTQPRGNRFLGIILFACGAFMAMRSALTFSRGGVYAAGLSAAVYFIVMIRNPQARLRFLLSVVVVFLIAKIVVVPRLVNFTGGAIKERFSETSLSGREEIFRDDMNIWLNHFLLGVGPGQSKNHRVIFGEPIAAHTEFSRLVSEHGVLGLAALMTLLCMGMKYFYRAKDVNAQAVIAGFLTWSALFMLVYGMRVAAPSVLCGFCACTILPPGKSPRDGMAPPDLPVPPMDTAGPPLDLPRSPGA